jgi:hypothetical protein
VLAGNNGGEEGVHCCQSDDAQLAELQCSEARRDIAAEREESSHSVGHLVKGREVYQTLDKDFSVLVAALNLRSGRMRGFRWTIVSMRRRHLWVEVPLSWGWPVHRSALRQRDKARPPVRQQPILGPFDTLSH